MKLVSLNVYGGICFAPLIEFIQSQAVDTDVFCFQEMQSTSGEGFVSNGARANLFQEVTKVLPDFQGSFAVSQQHYDQTALIEEEMDSGLATFVRKGIDIEEAGDFFIYGSLSSFVVDDYTTFPHNVQYTQLNISGKPLTIYNLHGTSRPSSKLDSPERLEQFQKVVDFMKSRSEEVIIMGDFNLMPNTQSIKLFEEIGLRNLVKEYDIKTTRGTMMRTLFPHYEHGPFGWQEFADYTFISPGIVPVSFTVPDVSVSDHLPMILEIRFLA